MFIALEDLPRYDTADAGNRIPEEDRLDVFSKQEQPIALGRH
jgi:hypothetical protein